MALSAFIMYSYYRHCRTFSSPQMAARYPLRLNSHFPHPPSPPTQFLTATARLSVAVDFLILGISCKWSLEYVAFCVWLHLFSWGFEVHWVTASVSCIVWNVFGYTTLWLSVHLLIDIWVISTWKLLWVCRVAMYIYVQIFEYPFSVCWSIYLGVKLRSQKVILFLI